MAGPDLQEIDSVGEGGDVHRAGAAGQFLPQHLLPDGVEDTQALKGALRIAQLQLVGGGVGADGDLLIRSRLVERIALLGDEGEGLAIEGIVPSFFAYSQALASGV